MESERDMRTEAGPMFLALRQKKSNKPGNVGGLLKLEKAREWILPRVLLVEVNSLKTFYYNILVIMKRKE